jgi:uronate dehydrogenase
MIGSAAPVLLTGASGRVATVLRPMLRSRSEVLLTDLRPPEQPLEPGETFVSGDLRDSGFADRIAEDVAAIVHLAGEPGAAADWNRLVEFNIMMTSTLLDAARRQQVPRLVIASSVHAIGGHNDPRDWPVDGSVAARPCCPYGVSKAAIEALARLYSDEVADSHVSCLRFALAAHPLRWRQESRAWLADDDLQTLVLASLEAPIDYGVYVGASNSHRPRFDLRAAENDLGWRPAVQVPEHDLPVLEPPADGRCRLWRSPPDA